MNFRSVAVVVLFVAATAFAAPTYTITPIPALNPGPTGQTWAYGLTENGMVVGCTRDGSQYEQAIYWTAGVTKGLGRLDGSIYSVSKALAAKGGVIVGYSEYNGYGTKVVVWDKDGMHDLGHDGDQSSAMATDVNSSGLVVGNYGNGAGAFIADNYIVTLIMPPSGWYAPAFFGVNDDGVAVGTLNTYMSTTYAAMWNEQDGWTVIPGPNPHSFAYDINNLGTVVGRYSGGIDVPYRWSVEGGLVSLPCLNNRSSRANAINDSGIIVGQGIGQDWANKAVMWQDDQVYSLYDLLTNPQGWSNLEVAQDINNRGQIVGWGIYNGQTTGFILDVPEPASLSMLLIGTLALLRRKRPARA